MRHVNKILLIAFSISAFGLFGQVNRDKIEQKIEAQKVAFITQQLELTPGEAEKFWPIYNQYKNEMKELKSNYPMGIDDWIDVTEEDAKFHLKAFLDREAREVELKKNYIDRITNVLSYKKTLRLLRLEREFKTRILKGLQERRARGMRSTDRRKD